MWHKNILSTIGQTPLVRLNRITAHLSVQLLAKLEFLNPGGSVKDRIGVAMLEGAIERGEVKPGGTVIECTSGNTGAGVAMAAITRGLKCIFTTTDKQSREKVDVLRALGAEVRVCPTNVPADDPRSYYSVARRLSQEIPNSVHLNQYDNPDNERAHYETTGPELWQQTDGRITHFICGAGTGGTISGTTRYLKEQNPAIRTIGVDPYGSVYYKYFHTREFDPSEIYPYITEGVGEDILAGNMDFDRVDDFVRVDDRTAQRMTRRLAREEGIFAGQSSGLAAAGAVQWVETNREGLSPDDLIVVLLPDSGFRYLSKTYNDDWMRGHGFLDEVSEITVAGIVARRGARTGICSLSPDHTVADAVSLMSKHGISQVPIVDGARPVGSVTEKGILRHLVEHPTAAGEPVRAIMEAAFPVVSPGLGLGELSALLDQERVAVLVETSDGYDILTKADLIAALAGGNVSAPQQK